MTVVKCGKEVPSWYKALDRRVRDSGATPFFQKLLTQSDITMARAQVSRVFCFASAARSISAPQLERQPSQQYPDEAQENLLKFSPKSSGDKKAAGSKKVNADCPTGDHPVPFSFQDLQGNVFNPRLVAMKRSDYAGGTEIRGCSDPLQLQVFKLQICWNFFVTGLRDFFEAHDAQVGSSMIFAWRNFRGKTGLIVSCCSPPNKSKSKLTTDSDAPPGVYAKKASSQPPAPSTPAGKHAKCGRGVVIDLAADEGDAGSGGDESRPSVGLKQRACAGGRGGGAAAVAAAARRAVKQEHVARDIDGAAASSGKRQDLKGESVATSERPSGHEDHSQRDSRAVHRQLNILQMNVVRNPGSDPSSRSSGGAAVIGTSARAVKRAATSPNHKGARQAFPSTRPAGPRGGMKRLSSQRAAAVGAAAAVAAAAAAQHTRTVDSADHMELAAAVAAVDKACAAAQSEKRMRNERALARAAVCGPAGGSRRKRGSKKTERRADSGSEEEEDDEQARSRSPPPREKKGQRAARENYSNNDDAEDAETGEGDDDNMHEGVTPQKLTRGGSNASAGAKARANAQANESANPPRATHEHHASAEQNRGGKKKHGRQVDQDQEQGGVDADGDQDAHMHDIEDADPCDGGTGNRASGGGSNNNQNRRAVQRRGVDAQDKEAPVSNAAQGEGEGASPPQQGGAQRAEETQAEGGLEGDPLSLNDPWLKDFLGCDLEEPRDAFLGSDLEAPCKRRRMEMPSPAPQNSYRDNYSTDSDTGQLRVAFQGAGRSLIARQSFPLPLKRKHKQVQEQFIGEVIDEFLREPGTDAAEEKRSCRRGREQHVTIVLPPELLQKLPKLNSKMQQMHTAAVAMDPSLSLYGSAPTECVISEGSVLGLAGLVVTLQRIEGLGEERNFGEEMEVLQWFGNTQLHASFAAQTLMMAEFCGATEAADIIQRWLCKALSYVVSHLAAQPQQSTEPKEQLTSGMSVQREALDSETVSVTAIPFFGDPHPERVGDPQATVQHLIKHDDVEGAAASAGAVRPHRLSIREAVCFPVALFRLWIRAQKSLMLPISSLSTEDIIQVNAGLLEACGQLKELVIVRDHEDDIRNEALEIHACTSVATAAGGADHVPSATQRQRHRCLEENGRGLWMLQLALERVGSLQRLELHGQTIKPSEVSQLASILEDSALTSTLLSLTLCSFTAPASSYSQREKRALFAALEVLESLEELTFPDWREFVRERFLVIAAPTLHELSSRHSLKKLRVGSSTSPSSSTLRNHPCSGDRQQQLPEIAAGNAAPEGAAADVSDDVIRLEGWAKVHARGLVVERITPEAMCKCPRMYVMHTQAQDVTQPPLQQAHASARPQQQQDEVANHCAVANTNVNTAPGAATAVQTLGTVAAPIPSVVPHVVPIQYHKPATPQQAIVEAVQAVVAPATATVNVSQRITQQFMAPMHDRTVPELWRSMECDDACIQGTVVQPGHLHASVSTSPVSVPSPAATTEGVAQKPKRHLAQAVEASTHVEHGSVQEHEHSACMNTDVNMEVDPSAVSHERAHASADGDAGVASGGNAGSASHEQAKEVATAATADGRPPPAPAQQSAAAAAKNASTDTSVVEMRHTRNQTAAAAVAASASAGSLVDTRRTREGRGALRARATNSAPVQLGPVSSPRRADSARDAVRPRVHSMAIARQVAGEGRPQLQHAHHAAHQRQQPHNRQPGVRTANINSLADTPATNAHGNGAGSTSPASTSHVRYAHMHAQNANDVDAAVAAAAARDDAPAEQEGVPVVPERGPGAGGQSCDSQATTTGVALSSPAKRRDAGLTVAREGGSGSGVATAANGRSGADMHATAAPQAQVPAQAQSCAAAAKERDAQQLFLQNRSPVCAGSSAGGVNTGYRTADFALQRYVVGDQVQNRVQNISIGNSSDGGEGTGRASSARSGGPSYDAGAHACAPGLDQRRRASEMARLLEGGGSEGL